MCSFWESWRKRMGRLLSLLILMIAPLAICNAGTAMAQPQPGATAPTLQSPSTMDDPSYRLGPGDKLQITTFGEASLTGTFEVSGSGYVAIPLVGQVKAQGLSTVEFGHQVEAALREGYLKNPNVSVEVLNYRPFFILGEVNKPGEYPFTNGLTVLNAVATANGFTYRANTRSVFIKRANEAAEHSIDLSPTTPVNPGDTIRVKERYF